MEDQRSFGFYQYLHRCPLQIIKSGDCEQPAIHSEALDRENQQASHGHHCIFGCLLLLLHGQRHHRWGTNGLPGLRLCYQV